MLRVLDRQIDTTLLLLFRERYVDTVDCLLVGSTATRGVLISVFSLTCINTAEVVSRAVVEVVHITHINLRLLNLMLNIFAISAGRSPLFIPLISKDHS